MSRKPKTMRMIPGDAFNNFASNPSPDIKRFISPVYPLYISQNPRIANTPPRSAVTMTEKNSMNNENIPASVLAVPGSRSSLQEQSRNAPTTKSKIDFMFILLVSML